MTVSHSLKKIGITYTRIYIFFIVCLFFVCFFNLDFFISGRGSLLTQCIFFKTVVKYGRQFFSQKFPAPLLLSLHELNLSEKIRLVFYYSTKRKLFLTYVYICISNKFYINIYHIFSLKICTS